MIYSDCVKGGLYSIILSFHQFAIVTNVQLLSHWTVMFFAKNLEIFIQIILVLK